MANIYGFFSSPYDEEPTYDPGLDISCPACKQPLLSTNRKTVSFSVPGSDRSWFYRIHAACSTPELEIELESAVIDGGNV